MEIPSGENSYGGGCGTKKQHPPEELGRDFQEGSGWKSLPGRTVMEGGAELKNSIPRKNWEGISRRGADGNPFRGEQLWRGVRNYK